MGSFNYQFSVIPPFLLVIVIVSFKWERSLSIYLAARFYLSSAPVSQHAQHGAKRKLFDFPIESYHLSNRGLGFFWEKFLHLERGCEDGNFIFVKIDFSSFGEACCSGVQSNSTQRKEQRAELYYSPFLPLLSFIVFSLGHGVLISIFAALLIVKKQSFSRERYLSRFLSFS